jgi:hypothetical protein
MDVAGMPMTVRIEFFRAAGFVTAINFKPFAGVQHFVKAQCGANTFVTYDCLDCRPNHVPMCPKHQQQSK